MLEKIITPARKQARQGAFRQWTWWIVIVIAVISRICWYGIQQPYVVYPDSTQYISFDTSEVLRGNFNAAEGRPPLYGIFLDFMQMLFHDGYLDATKWVQLILSVLSIFLLAKILHRIGIRSPWRELCVLFYSVTPAVVGWEGAILTESFALSGTVLFFYWVVLYIQEHRLRYGILSNILALLLAFLRPQFMVYLALLLVFYLLKMIFPYNKEERRTVLSLLLLQVVLWGGILGYCSAFEKQTGVFSLSITLPVQNLRLCIDRGYYKDFDDAEMAEFIGRRMDAQQEPIDVCNAALGEFGFKRSGETAKRYLSSHIVQNLADTVDVIINDVQSPFRGYNLHTSQRNAAAPGIFYKMYAVQMALFGFVTVGHALLASVLEGIVMVVVWVRRRRPPWLHMALFSISFCTTFVTYFVTNAEYMRTMSSIMPYFVCLVGMALQKCSEYFASGDSRLQMVKS